MFFAKNIYSLRALISMFLEHYSFNTHFLTTSILHEKYCQKNIDNPIIFIKFAC